MSCSLSPKTIVVAKSYTAYLLLFPLEQLILLVAQLCILSGEQRPPLHFPGAESERILPHYILFYFIRKVYSWTSWKYISFYSILRRFISTSDFQRWYFVHQSRVLLRLFLFTSDGTVRTQSHSRWWLLGVGCDQDPEVQTQLHSLLDSLFEQTDHMPRTRRVGSKYQIRKLVPELYR